ncbi:unnamed protein product [Staurois parvus]|uniref:Uncharacterized protein n=1 Tax=Staurois parvus TaxID=386267 RepID=A0ABN9BLU2_9NEOB|nr:unnamed protein product [Staurois parvus]
MPGPGRADIVHVGSGESGYSEWVVRGREDILICGTRESGYSAYNAGSGEMQDIVNAGSGADIVNGWSRERQI